MIVNAEIHNESEVEVMKCVNCGQEIPDGTKFCPYCGTSQMMKCVNCDQEIPGGTKFCPYCGAKQIIYVAPESEEQPLANERPESLEQAPSDEQTESLNQTSVNEHPDTLEQGAQNEPGLPPAEAAAQEQVEEPAQKQPVYQYQQPQQPYQQVRTGETVNWVPYLVLSILSTVCCCVPFGIVAIVYAVKINSLVSEGKIDEARSAAKTARIWIIVAFAVGIIFDIVVFLFIFISGAGYYGGIYDVIHRVTYYY